VVQVRVHGSPLLRFHTLTPTDPDPDPCNNLPSPISTARVFFFTTALLSGGEKNNTLSQIFKDRRQKQGKKKKKKKKKKKDTLRKRQMKPCRETHTRELEERQEHSDSRIATRL
jgi:hypothetical protein